MELFLVLWKTARVFDQGKIVVKRHHCGERLNGGSDNESVGKGKHKQTQPIAVWSPL